LSQSESIKSTLKNIIHGDDFRHISSQLGDLSSLTTVMKKITVTILILLYFTTSIGATIQMHYCMGKLADWAIGHNESKTCGKCGMDKKSGKTSDCCKDEYQVVKNDSHQKTAETAIQFLQSITNAVTPEPITLQADYFPPVIRQNHWCHAPPEPSNLAVHIRNCTFLI
jgi:hypothetical protein